MKKAFSLIEIIVALSIFVLLFLIIGGFFKGTFEQSRVIREQINATYNAERISNSIIKLIRELRDGQDGSFPIYKADDFELSFFADIDLDGDVEKVRFFLDQGVLKQGVIDPQGFPPEYIDSNEIIKKLAYYVVNTQSDPIFYYYNGNWPKDQIGNPLVTPASRKDIKLIRINFLIDVDLSRIPVPSEVETVVYLRNLKDNY